MKATLVQPGKPFSIVENSASKRKTEAMVSLGNENRILGETDATFWKEKMIEFGGDYLIWSNAPENPSYN